MSAFHEEQHEDAIAVCGCLVSTAAFFLSSTLMCSSVAAGACQSLLAPLQHQKKLRKLLNKGNSANLLTASGTGEEDEGRMGANHDEGNERSPSHIIMMSASSSSSLLAASSSPLSSKTETREEQSVVHHGTECEERAHRDDELVVRLFHAGFMVFLVCQRWRVGRVSSHARETAFADSEKSRGLCGFADCCGGVVKLDRADLLAECLEAVCCSIEPSVPSGCSVTSAATAIDSSSSLGMAFEGNYMYGTAPSTSSTSPSSSLGASVPARAAMRYFDEEDCATLKAFVAAVVERHPHTEASVNAARLLVLLGDANRLFPSCNTEDDDDDDEYSAGGESNAYGDNKVGFDGAEERKKRSPTLLPSFVASFITLISRWSSFAVLEAVRMIADRVVSTKDWYEADVGVLLQTLRMGEGRETDAPAKCLIERAIRVVIRDTLLVNRGTLGGDATEDGYAAQNERHMLALWLSRMELSEDYFDSFVERGVSVRDLTGGERNGEGATCIGRLEILDKLGVAKMDDVEKIFRVLSE